MAGIDYARLYKYRIRHIDLEKRQKVWNAIAAYIYVAMDRPEVVLDPAAGNYEYLNATPARERWGVDAASYAVHRDPMIKAITANIGDVQLPEEYFDGVFISNFLEHLSNQDEIADLLAQMRSAMKTGGRITIIGPNFRHCVRSYFDYADHVLALSHLAVIEHLSASGFRVTKARSRFLPYSFSGILPASRSLTAAYLRVPLAWHILGKQFLVIATKE